MKNEKEDEAAHKPKYYPTVPSTAGPSSSSGAPAAWTPLALGWNVKQVLLNWFLRSGGWKKKKRRPCRNVNDTTLQCAANCVSVGSRSPFQGWSAASVKPCVPHGLSASGLLSGTRWLVGTTVASDVEQCGGSSHRAGKICSGIFRKQGLKYIKKEQMLKVFEAPFCH